MKNSYPSDLRRSPKTSLCVALGVSDLRRIDVQDTDRFSVDLDGVTVDRPQGGSRGWQGEERGGEGAENRFRKAHGNVMRT